MPAGIPMPSFSRSAGSVSASVDRHALDDELDGGTAVAHGAAELALGDGAEVAEILQPDRIIEAPGLAEGGDRLGRRLGTEDDLRRIAGHAQHDEGERHHQRDGYQRAAEPDGEEAEHQATFAAGIGVASTR